jgi:hypothetical protein
VRDSDQEKNMGDEWVWDAESQRAIEQAKRDVKVWLNEIEAERVKREQRETLIFKLFIATIVMIALLTALAILEAM